MQYTYNLTINSISLLLLFILLVLCSSLQTIILTPSSQSSAQSTTLYNSSSTPQISSQFIQQSNPFNCSLSLLYTYFQSQQQYSNPTSTFALTLTNFQYSTISIIPTYNNMVVYLNGTESPVECESLGQQCVIDILPICSQSLNTFNYFDILTVHVNETLLFQFNLICNQNYMGTTFEYGLFIQILFCTILITITAIYSKAWSISGWGVQLNLWVVISFNLILIIGGLIGFFTFQKQSYQVLGMIVNVISWIFGIGSVWLCTNEILFLIQIKSLKHPITVYKTFVIRFIDIISFIISLCINIGWWFSYKNWIINDVVSICLIIASIKIFKFISLKQAVICFSITIAVQLIYVLIFAILLVKSYNNIILNYINSPFQLQFPTINPIYNQKCSWLPVTAIIYPGAIMSYMRRFDTSKTTNVYIITCMFVFFIGSIVWMAMTFGTYLPWPYGLFVNPATFGIVSFFAWKRKQIKTLWYGQFHDQEFANQEQVMSINSSIEKQRVNTEIVYSPDLFKGLQIKNGGSSEFQQFAETKKEKEIELKDLSIVKQLSVNEQLNQSLLSNKSERNKESKQTITGMQMKDKKDSLDEGNEGNGL